MRRVAVAMKTTGPKPKQGRRTTELAAVEIIDGGVGRCFPLLLHPRGGGSGTGWLACDCFLGSGRQLGVSV